MKTKDKPEIKQALEEGESEIGNMDGGMMAIAFLLQALVLAVCEVADGVNQIVADLPNHDN